MNNNLYTRAYDHLEFNRVVDQLLKNYVKRVFSFEEEEIDSYSLKKAGWVASILASSNVEVHKQKAQIFAALLFLLNREDVNFCKLSYIIFSRTGNLIATKFLSVLFETGQKDIKFAHDFGTVLDLEIGLKLLDNTVKLEYTSFLLTDFQNNLWKYLNSEKNIAISAPTSSGKSFIIQSFIRNKFENLDKYCVIYVVPSKALLNQVSEQFRKTLNKKISIKTAFINNQIREIKKVENVQKVMYILTPERCLNIVNQKEQSLSPDLIFVDEIQNVEDEEGRGVLMEHVLSELSKTWSTSKIVTAGPNISHGDVLFKSLFNRQGISVETELSPVFQIKTIISPDKANNLLKLKINSIKEERLQQLSLHPEFNVRNVFESGIGNILANVVPKFSENEQTIVYTPRTDYVENWSLELLDKIPINSDKDIQELIDFLKEEIHPKYYLIKCLQHGVAFHHSKLPELVRKEIENLFEKGKILYLYCTSTLMQGVNLPAKNLFVISARKQSEPLTPFEFGNLIGRAGRIKDSLYGSIYFITKNEDEISQAERYFSQNYHKEVTLATSKTMDRKNFIENDLSDINMDFNKNKSGYTITLLRHKYMAGSNELANYLEQKNFNGFQMSSMLKKLSDQLIDVSLPYDILKLNPSVDPLVQQTLFNKIQEEGIQNWVITKNPNFQVRIKKDDIHEYEFYELSFYWQFSLLCKQLDEIFEISRETFFKHKISGLGIGGIAHFAFRWLQNMSYKEIIEADIKYYGDKELIDPDNEKHINDRINKVMNIHSKVITFTLVKYFKVLTDILEYLLTDEEKENYKLTLSLPIMLELGTMESTMIQLISSGINRSVALQIYNEYKMAYVDVDVIEWLYLNGKNLSLKPIYIKYLTDLGFIQ